MTADELKRIMPYAGHARCELFSEPLTSTMSEFEIDASVERECMFIAQIAHESGSLAYTEEIASGKAYEGRADLGNTEPGDGQRFKGHGLIQITGRANHQAYADYLGKTIEETLDYLQLPDGAANCAGWFWMAHDLNALCDAGDFRALSAVINTGRKSTPSKNINGYSERLAYWRRATAVLS